MRFLFCFIKTGCVLLDVYKRQSQGCIDVALSAGSQLLAFGDFFQGCFDERQWSTYIIDVYKRQPADRVNSDQITPCVEAFVNARKWVEANKK